VDTVVAQESLCETARDGPPSGKMERGIHSRFSIVHFPFSIVHSPTLRLRSGQASILHSPISILKAGAIGHTSRSSPPGRDRRPLRLAAARGIGTKPGLLPGGQNPMKFSLQRVFAWRARGRPVCV